MNIKSENGSQVLVRLQGRPDVINFCPEIFERNLEYKDVVEITGHAGSGKTELLIRMITNCILPQDSGGLNSSVLLIDSDRNFDLLRLVHVLEAKLEQNIAKNQDKKQLVSTYLEKLLIIQPNDSSHVILTLHYLNDFLVSRSDVLFLMIDSISNFYWIDKMTAGDNMPQLRLRQQNQVGLLQKLIQQFGLVLIVTRQVLFNPKHAEKDEKVDQVVSDFMGWNWQKFVTTSISVSLNAKILNVQVKKKTARSHTNFYITDSGLV